MKVGVGYSEQQDTDIAGVNAAKRALMQARRKNPDLVLLFSTSWHDPRHLRASVASVVGHDVPIIGGGAVGAITNDRFGYAGSQVGLAAIWLDGIGFNLFAKGGLVYNEKVVGERIGVRMAENGVRRDGPCMLFYDAVHNESGDVGLNLATPLLQGLEKGLGFLPDGLVGMGMQGDYDSRPTSQWVGSDTAERQAMVLTFGDKLRIDSVIMHGCHPFGEYYTVTKADRQTILEVDGKPAIPYIESRLQPSLPATEFPFFMIFGINRNPGGEYNEKNYANRLCLAIDRKRNGIVMFESDMVEGTKFQIMYRSLDLDYIPPKIQYLLKSLDGRKPVFAFYIDCAGRAARYGAELEDAVVVQKALGDRVPLLGVYSGVEIAPIMGVPRTLDWTGVFCLFSVEE